MLLILFSFTLLVPLLISYLYQDETAEYFLLGMVAIFSAGILLWLPTRHQRQDLSRRDGFLVVALFWVVLGCFSAVPLQMILDMDFVDAVFEAVSAFTTTGATVLTHLDDMPPALLFYRQQLQWYGGMGVVVLAIAVLPMLGIGGMQLFRAETPGLVKDEKIAPRITRCARSFWLIYLGMTCACALAYWLAGMTVFDAIAHSLSTISTGGFSTHDASLGYFHNTAVELVAVLFMVLGGVNFSIHYFAIASGSPRAYWRDVEVRAYGIMILGVFALVAFDLAHAHYHQALGEILRASLFQTVSVITSTGFLTEDFSRWPDFAPLLLFYASFVGGCAGSTAGGMKVIRVLVVLKQAGRDLVRIVHPRLVRPLKLAGRVLPGEVISAVWGFFSLYVALFAIFMLCLMALGVDQISAFSAVATCMNNLGPGLGQVAENFQNFPVIGKWLLILAMLMGRLEIYTLLVLLAPSLWRQ
ncbi:MAG: TrkH family potassium uptake protein [Gammaproteobacteria bacterium]